MSFEVLLQKTLNIEGIKPAIIALISLLNRFSTLFSV